MMDSYLAAKLAEKRAAALAEIMAEDAERFGTDFVVQVWLPRLLEIGRQCKMTLNELPENIQEAA